jgi:hypothetical protein
VSSCGPLLGFLVWRGRACVVKRGNGMAWSGTDQERERERESRHVPRHRTRGSGREVRERRPRLGLSVASGGEAAPRDQVSTRGFVVGALCSGTRPTNQRPACTPGRASLSFSRVRWFGAGSDGNTVTYVRTRCGSGAGG